MPKNANKITYKEKEFQTYVLWKSMPAYFRGMKKEQLQSYGFTDPLILKIAMIKNQTTFAKKFNIKDLGTLTDWNNKIEKNKLNNNALNLVFKNQTMDVKNAISVQPDKLLEKKIYEQRKLILLLKRENKFFKKQIDNNLFKKVKKIKATKLIESKTVPDVPKNDLNIFQKLKNIILKWK
jgi:hypothetical protein